MRILVVDDDYVSRVKLKSIFGHYGDCDGASDGESALFLFKKAFDEGVAYQVVSMDIDMPDMDGKEVLNQIRAFEQQQGIVLSDERAVKVFMVSGMEMREHFGNSFKQGCDFYIKKPIDNQKVEAAFSSVRLLRK